MNRTHAKRTIGLALALVAVLAIGAVAAEPGGGPSRHDLADRRPLRINLAAAAETLGVAEDALKDALGDPEQGPPDLAAAAETLGVAEDALIEALGIPAGGPAGGAGRGHGGPPCGGRRGGRG